MFKSLSPLPLHAFLWQRFETQLKKGRVPHGFLMSGALYTELERLAERMLAALFCKLEKNLSLPCGQCQSCRLIAAREHPDIIFINPDKTHGLIKIDQIRHLDKRLFTTSQLSQGRGIIINPADKMNRNASNALLKILEEPPANTYFLLIAEQISTIPATIISRCQRFSLAIPDVAYRSYSDQGEAYSPDSGRGKAFAMQEVIVQNLLDLHTMKISVFDLANSWAALALPDLIWLLYLLHAEMIRRFFIGLSNSSLATSPLALLAKRLQPPKLYAQLDKLNQLIRIIGNISSINAKLWLEAFLLEYVTDVKLN